MMGQPLCGQAIILGLLTGLGYLAPTTVVQTHRFGDGGTKLQVEEFSGFPPPKQFFDHYVLRSQPVKMTKAATLSRAFTLWDDDYFLSSNIPNDVKVSVETRKKENRGLEPLALNFKEFVKTYNQTEQYMVSAVPQFLCADVVLPWSLQCDDIVEDHLVDNVMWYSSGGTKSVVHTDAVDNIICLFRGEKHFVMVDPDKFNNQVDIDHPEGAYSDIDVDEVDYEKYPGLKGIEYYHVDLEAGDCMFIPFKWIHQVASYNHNIAVNIWWDHHRNQEIDFDHCTSAVDLLLTLDKVNFVSFSDMASSIAAIKDQLIDFSTRVKDLSLDKYCNLMTGGSELSNAGEGYKVALRKVFVALDQNRDNILHVNEVLAADQKQWEKVQEGMVEFEEIMDAIVRMEMEAEEDDLEEDDLEDDDLEDDDLEDDDLEDDDLEEHQEL